MAKKTENVLKDGRFLSKFWAILHVSRTYALMYYNFLTSR